MLSVISSIFDLLGLLGPFIVKGKMILQELWRLGYDWDSSVQGHPLRCWKQWLDGVAKISSFQLPRCYYDESPSVVELHVFGDASELAYGAVAYLRFKSKTGNLSTTLVMY